MVPFVLEMGLDTSFEVDVDFQADVGVMLDGLAVREEVKLDFLYRKNEPKKSIPRLTLFELDFPH